ncbi:DUF6542 domain-containing protein [Geodermatophilus sp. DSM 45219]|uniref:DUF6542 domain-containing protein n=1 Tax=Geodermatophilus sp. DSM 45219 TaxID=1881103 RepID=UPI00115FF048|nr:DUF6542 domain-containing protein [Geodermatophilus sp. DSM 45219]
MSTADTWRESGSRAGRRLPARPEAAEYVSRIGRPPVPPPPPRMRSTELPPFPEDMARSARGRDERPAPARPRVPGERVARPVRDVPVHADADPRSRGREDRLREDRLREDRPRDDRPRDDRDARSRGPRPPEPRPANPRPARRVASAPAPESGRVRGLVAVLLVFLVTLGAAALESWLAAGLGLVTVVALTAASTVAALVVRRRDLSTALVAPPLVYVLVAVLNTALAPSASLNAASVATLLIRGFPAMAIATAAAVVVGLIRWAARR